MSALLLGGCGVLDEPEPRVASTPDPAVYGPAKADPEATPVGGAQLFTEPDAAVARELDAGAVGLVDADGIVRIRPTTLRTASDAELLRVRWERWDASGAAGSGTLRVLDCQPTCAGGGSDEHRARIVLRQVTRCNGRRYFARAELGVDDGPAPAVYIGAPC